MGGSESYALEPNIYVAHPPGAMLVINERNKRSQDDKDNQKLHKFNSTRVESGGMLVWGSG